MPGDSQPFRGPSELPYGCVDADAKVGICSLFDHHFWFGIDYAEDNAGTICCPEPGCGAPIHVYIFEGTVTPDPFYDDDADVEAAPDSHAQAQDPSKPDAASQSSSHGQKEGGR